MQNGERRKYSSTSADHISQLNIRIIQIESNSRTLSLFSDVLLLDHSALSWLDLHNSALHWWILLAASLSK